jgi:hypothetical protein
MLESQMPQQSLKSRIQYGRRPPDCRGVLSRCVLSAAASLTIVLGSVSATDADCHSGRFSRSLSNYRLVACTGSPIAGRQTFVAAPPASLLSSSPLSRRPRDRSGSPPASESTWWDRADHGQAGHYWIKTDLSQPEARELARHLNMVHNAINRQLGSLPRRHAEHLNVFVFRDYEDYLFTLRTRFDINAIGTGGVFFMRPEGGAIAIWIGERPQRRIAATLQHEQFHLFAHSRFGADLPTWADEGLAMLFGEAVLVPGDARRRQGDALLIGKASQRMIDAVRTAIEQNAHLPFRDILNMDSQQWWQSMQAGRAPVMYQQAWSMVQFLIYAEGGRYRHEFERYLRLINEGMRPAAAFEQAFELPIAPGATSPAEPLHERMERAWRRYMMDEISPSPLMTAIERIEFLAAGMIELNRRGIRPTTFEELRKELTLIDFNLPMTVHGVTALLSADDEQNFAIPHDTDARRKPEFVLVEPQRRLRTHREREQERENPMPFAIETRGLEPHELRIEWKRHEKSNTFSYEIIIR